MALVIFLLFNCQKPGFLFLRHLNYSIKAIKKLNDYFLKKTNQVLSEIVI